MSFRSWLEAHQRSVLFLFAVLAVGGIASLWSLPVGLFPRATFPRVVVNVDAGDRPADRMVVEVTRPLEEAIRGVQGVRSVRSNTSRGSADISVDFDWGVDMVASTLLVDSAISQAVGSLPSGVSYEVRRMDPTVFPVIGLSLSSKSRSLVELRDRALYDLGPRLSTIRGVSRIRVQGGRTEELQVLVDPVRLDAAGVTLDNVVRAVSAANVVQAVGRLEQQEKLYLVLSDTQFTNLGELEHVIVKQSPKGVVLLDDVATVRDAPAPQWTRVVAHGRDAVLVDVYQQRNGNTVQIASDLRQRLDEYKARAPKDLEIRTWYDQTDLINASVSAVRDAALIGVLLAVLVLWLFLRNLRITLVASICVPAVLAITLLLLRAMGQGINIMTLGGMASAIGLVLDDGIVMVEHGIHRLRGSGHGRRDTLLEAAREMAVPLTGSSLATVTVFVPLAFLSGVTGAFFKALSLTMASALVVSYLFAFLGVPLLSAMMLRPRDAKTEDIGPILGKVLSGYRRLLTALLARPAWLLLGVVPLLALGWVAYRHTGSGFMPAMDEGGFVLDYRAPPGTSLTETDRRLRQLEKILQSIPEVSSYSRRTGIQLGGGLTEANEGDYFVRLKPPPRRTIDEVMDEVREKVQQRVPGVTIELAQLMEDLIGDLTAVPQPIEVKLFGATPDQLRTEARRVAARIRKVNGVVDVKSGVVLAGDALDIRVDRLKAERLGLDPEEVTHLAEVVVGGVVTTQVQRGEKMVGIRVWTEPELRKRMAQIRDLPLITSNGTRVRLGRVASIERKVGQPQITRDNLKTMVAVTGRISGRDMGSVMKDVKSAVGGMSMPPGAYVGYGGLYQEQQKSFRGLIGVMVAAVLLLFALLLYLYERFSAPLAILAVALLSTTAVFSGLWWTGTELNITSMMGLTMIVGISSEAAVFYMSQWKDLDPAMPADERLLEAGVLRFRPILMTALAAILALVPLALSIGQGSAMLAPLAIAIISGLVLTVPAVLLVLPVLFHLLGGTRGQRA